jgi:hypothetical protein
MLIVKSECDVNESKKGESVFSHINKNKNAAKSEKGCKKAGKKRQDGFI